MDRHVLANMGAELGATSTVFPSDEEVRHFLRRYGREEDWVDLRADEDARYEHDEEIDLSSLEPLIATPTSPGNVVPVRELAGQDLYQAYIGSSANPGYRDFAISALMVQGRKIPDHISFDINPTSRGTLETLLREGMIDHLIHAGARLHQAGCNGCIGMGQAPATGRNSLRTVPRNFPGRSGTKEDAVFLCSPETATASALMGVITDPRDLKMFYPQIEQPEEPVINRQMLMPPLPEAEARQVSLVKGPNIFALPELDTLPNILQVPILLKVGDNISTDEILPAGSRVLPYRSNIPKISEFVFDVIDSTYPKRAAEQRELGGHALLGGSNYDQGSSREHAALAPRYLGLRVVITQSLARIHRKNLINYGVLPLVLSDATVYGRLEQGDVLRIENIHQGILQTCLPVFVEGKNFSFTTIHNLSSRDVDVLLAGGVTNWLRQRRQ
jgi:aconitate hydratase